MVITDFNEMSLEELDIINRTYGKEYTVEDGRITAVEGGNNGELGK